MICNARDTFQCSPSECILWSYVCDGISQCSNKADEDCDMCNNDLYTCRDSSRINCTLACNTLGYIPCRNYMDRKVCSSVIKKTHRFFNVKSKDKSFQFISSSGHEINLFGLNFSIDDSILFLVLGIVILGSLFLTLVILSIRLRQRNRQRKFSIRAHDVSNLNDANNQIVDDDEHNLDDDSFLNQTNLESDLNRKFFDPFNNETKYKRIERLPSKSDNEETNHNELYSTNIHKKQKSNNSDYQLYGEPPPSYDQSKYFPRSTTFELNTKTDESHIYENIDESSSNEISTTIATSEKKKQRNFKSSNRKRLDSALKQINVLNETPLNQHVKLHTENNDELL